MAPLVLERRAPRVASRRAARTSGRVVRRRLGIDLNPVDVTTEEGSLLLQSFVWVGQTARLERLRLAIEAVARRPAGARARRLRRALARGCSPSAIRTRSPSSSRRPRGCTSAPRSGAVAARCRSSRRDAAGSLRSSRRRVPTTRATPSGAAGRTWPRRGRAAPRAHGLPRSVGRVARELASLPVMLTGPRLPITLREDPPSPATKAPSLGPVRVRPLAWCCRSENPAP